VPSRIRARAVVVGALPHRLHDPRFPEVVPAHWSRSFSGAPSPYARPDAHVVLGKLQNPVVSQIPGAHCVESVQANCDCGLLHAITAVQAAMAPALTRRV
jgi:hypothetical protein